MITSQENCVSCQSRMRLDRIYATHAYGYLSLKETQFYFSSDSDIGKHSFNVKIRG